ncbi:MAG: DUF2339 domain-containing protein [Gemmatimonadales bacterium]
MAVDPARLDALEHTIGRLTLELGDARRALAALRSEAAVAAASPAAPPARAPVRNREQLENLVGRYGALALAVLTIIMGAGALVSWAITHNLLGPWIRVALGALLAVLVAAVGWWQRERGSRAFGNVLLALALAIVDVVAWGAGPRLGLVHPSVSLTIADAAAGALATLAVIEGQELLFTVGLGGALIAPFAMATGVPHFGLLAAYGLVVIAAAIRTVGERPWSKAALLIAAATVGYTLSVRGFHGEVPWMDREFAAGFAAAVAVIALVVARRPTRPWVTLCAASSMALVVHYAGPAATSRLSALLATPDIQLAGLAGTGLLLAAAHDIDPLEFAAAWLVAVLLVPGLLLMGALEPLRPVEGPVAGAVVLTWALTYSAASLFEQGIRRGALLAAGGLAGVWAIPLLLQRAPDTIPSVLAAYAVLLAVVSRQEKQPVVLLPAGVSLLLGFMMAASHLALRTGYTAAPFLSIDSLGMACAVAAALVSARYGLPEQVWLSGYALGRGRVGALLASALAFIWGDLELRRAFSADVSTFLLIAWYASCGVLAIHQGRTRGEGGLRQAGLALSVVAALYAISAASGVGQIGLRVGSYLLVGAFLLGVAWWYRGAQRSD